MSKSKSRITKGIKTISKYEKRMTLIKSLKNQFLK